MPVVVHGSGLYGRIDRVEGLFHVATKFGHLYYVPLFPVESWLVLSEEGDQFSGMPLPMQWRSILAAYARSWGGLAAVIAAIAAAWPAAEMVVGPNPGDLNWVLRWALGLGPAVLILLTMLLRWRGALVTFLAWAGMTLGMLLTIQNLRSEWHLYPRCWVTIAVAIGLIFLVNRWRYASPRRALELAGRVGIPPEEVVARIPVSPDAADGSPLEAARPAARPGGFFGFGRGGVSTRKLIARTRDRDDTIRLNAAEELAGRPEPGASAALVGLLSDTHTGVRVAARQGLIQHGPAAVEPLIEALQHHDEQIATTAAELLGELNDGRAAAPLAQALVHAPRPVQLAAIRSLGDMGRPAADAVRALAEHESPWVRRHAQELLARLGG